MLLWKNIQGDGEQFCWKGFYFIGRYYIHYHANRNPWFVAFSFLWLLATSCTGALFQQKKKKHHKFVFSLFSRIFVINTNAEPDVD